MKLYVVSRLLLKFPMNRVSDDDPSTLLSFLSCGALQNDEIIIGILKVLSSTSGSAHGWRCAASTGWRVRHRGARPHHFLARREQEAHFVKLAYLARQSHRLPTRVGCATEEGGWLLVSATSSEEWNRCFSHHICLSLFVSVVAFVCCHCDGAS